MRKAFLIIALLTATATVIASPVGKDRAARVAQNAVVRFCAELHGIAPDGAVELTDVSQGLGFKLLHIYKYRYAGIEGFIVVSGDDCADPVLAFSDEGELDLSG